MRGRMQGIQGFSSAKDSFGIILAAFFRKHLKEFLKRRRSVSTDSIVGPEVKLSSRNMRIS